MILIYSALHVLVGFLNQIDALACYADGFVRDRQFCGNRVCIFFLRGGGVVLNTFSEQSLKTKNEIMTVLSDLELINTTKLTF